MRSKPRKILIVGSNYAPELTGIGKYTAEMAEFLAHSGWSVSVITAPPYYPDWQIRSGYRNWYNSKNICGVKVCRAPIWIPRSLSGFKRILSSLSFATSFMLPMLSEITRRPSIVMVIEPPLLCAPFALLAAKVCRAKSILHIQDYEVDAAFELGILSSPILRSIAQTLEKILVKNFDIVSTISNAMIEKLDKKGVEKDKQVLFPNWVDTDSLKPNHDKNQNIFSGMIPENSKVLLYSGNMGEKQGLDIIIEAAQALKHNSEIHFIMCGEGAVRKRLEQSAKDLNNITFLPLQPLEHFNDLLNLATIHLIPQKADVTELVMPSKLTGILAVGGIVLATAPEDSELARCVREAGGFVAPPDSIEEFVELINQIISETANLDELRKKARAFAISRLSKEAILRDFNLNLEKLLIK